MDGPSLLVQIAEPFKQRFGKFGKAVLGQTGVKIFPDASECFDEAASFGIEGPCVHVVVESFEAALEFMAAAEHRGFENAIERIIGAYGIECLCVCGILIEGSSEEIPFPIFFNGLAFPGPGFCGSRCEDVAGFEINEHVCGPMFHFHDACALGCKNHQVDLAPIRHSVSALVFRDGDVEIRDKDASVQR